MNSTGEIEDQGNKRPTAWWHRGAQFRADRYRLQITREGMLLYLLLFAIGFAAYNTGSNLLFLFMSIIVALSMTHTMLNYHIRRRHRIERRLPQTLFAGSPFQVLLRLTNRKRFFTSYSIILQDEDEWENKIGRAHFIEVKPGETREQSYEAVFARRGPVSFRRAWLICRYPFGFSMNSTGYDVLQTRLVYPKIIKVQEIPELRAGKFGDMERHSKGFGSGLYGLREYQFGESSRFIHWKTSARLNQLMIKEFEDEQKRRVSVVFENTGNPKEDYDELFELLVSQTASLANYFIRQGWQTELITLSDQVPFGQGNGQLKKILDLLALIGPVAMDSRDAQHQISRILPVDGSRVVWVNRKGSVKAQVLSGSDLRAMPGRRSELGETAVEVVA